jgi:hypothetical protein
MVIQFGYFGIFLVCDSSEVSYGISNQDLNILKWLSITYNLVETSLKVSSSDLIICTLLSHRNIVLNIHSF